MYVVALLFWFHGLSTIAVLPRYYVSMYFVGTMYRCTPPPPPALPLPSTYSMVQQQQTLAGPLADTLPWLRHDRQLPARSPYFAQTIWWRADISKPSKVATHMSLHIAAHSDNQTPLTAHSCRPPMANAPLWGRQTAFHQTLEVGIGIGIEARVPWQSKPIHTGNSYLTYHVSPWRSLSVG